MPIPEEKREPVSDIDTAVVVDGLKALDPEWPIREAIEAKADMTRTSLKVQSLDQEQTSTHHSRDHSGKKSTTPVSRLYIAPAILMAPLDSIAASTGLSLRMLDIVISTFFRATASTNA